MEIKNRTPGTSRADKGKAILDLTKGRICNKCLDYKDRKHFYEHPTGFNGLGSKCKECILLEPIRPSKKILYQTRKEKHLCVKCGLPAIEHNVFCLYCWITYKPSYR